MASYRFATIPTRRVLIDACDAELDLVAEQDAALDDEFFGICQDTGETLRVFGWNCIVLEDSANPELGA